MRRGLLSEDPVSSAGGVHLLEGGHGAAIEHSLGQEALVLVEAIGSHAVLELLERIGAHSLEDGLAWGTFIFTRETAQESIS